LDLPTRQVERLAALLEAWVATLDPVRPGTMGATSTHAGCAAYAFPTAEAGPDGGASTRAQIDQVRRTPSWPRSRANFSIL
jgi:hypothetical protein